MVMKHRASPPDMIRLVYEEVGKTHVFTAENFPGFHIGASVLRKAYDDAIVALGEHVSRVYGCTVSYDTGLDFDAFLRHLKGEDTNVGQAGLLRPVIAKIATEQKVMS